MSRIIPVRGYTRGDGTRVRAHTRTIGGTAVLGGGALLAVMALLGLNNSVDPAPPTPMPSVTVYIGPR
ncbi:hypothetical protein KCMC57_up14050 [Kitasatospora sp. CMC57]|uniref:Uncharacterized protein n=1 Tax=Kitasatospora sp. CMC57 TaxID=3231513 RepID=A0AB33JQD3_9ACTN